MSIADLELEVQRLRGELRMAQDTLRQALIDAAPFQVGDVVEAQVRAMKWEQAIVRAINTSGAQFWYMVSLQKTDGTWGTQERHAFNRVRPVSSATRTAADEAPSASHVEVKG